MTAVCIAGMHRSGTSLTASWLERCGLSIHDGNPIGAAHGNPKGHFEDGDFVYFHVDAIDRQEPQAEGWRVTHDRPFEFSSDERTVAESLIARRATKFERWGWKDPRSTLFLDEWKAILPDLKVVLVWRPASDVVSSLWKRARNTPNASMIITANAAAQLWSTYNRRALAYRAQHPDDTVLIPLSRIVENDADAFAVIVGRLGIDLAYEPLAATYDSDLLSTRRTTRPGLVGAIASRRQGCADVERALRAASDLPIGAAT
jgi:hypothetical protein